MTDLIEIGKKARNASRTLNSLGQVKKNEALRLSAQALIDHTQDILMANKLDIDNAKISGMKDSLVDRLILNPDRIKSMADGLMELISLDDPVGEVTSMKVRPNGLTIGEKRVPLGVVGIIYESRPNVTADAFGLCFKSGNAVILRGGSDAINSNKIIVKAIKLGLEKANLTSDAIMLIEDTDRKVANEFMKLNQYVDVLIPRGGSGLINAVINNSTIPVIETGTGNCHTYVDEYADFNMALSIIENAKLQRLGVCNTCESLVIHENIKDKFIPLLYKMLTEHGVEIRGDEIAREIDNRIIPATEDDYGMEYLDKIISLKVVKDIDEAIEHINKYNTKHSDAIITKDYNNSLKFLDDVDSACVYVNASTRFSDGAEFGLGAEIGISNQKLHARGPMGINALTSKKFIIFGNGQIRE